MGWGIAVAGIALAIALVVWKWLDIPAEQRRAHLKHERELERITLMQPDQQLLIEQEKTKRAEAAGQTAKKMKFWGASQGEIAATVKQMMEGGE